MLTVRSGTDLARAGIVRAEPEVTLDTYGLLDHGVATALAHFADHVREDVDHE